MHQCWLKIHQSFPFCHLVSNNLVSSMWQSTSEPSVKNFLNLKLFPFCQTWTETPQNEPQKQLSESFIAHSASPLLLTRQISKFFNLLACCDAKMMIVKCQYMHFCREYDINELRSAFGNSFTHFEWWYWGKPEQRNLDLDLLGLFEM